MSCKKNETGITTPVSSVATDDMGSIAKMMDGDALTGNIAGTADDNSISLVFNKGSRYILIEKIPGMPGVDVNAVDRAVLITSKYGVIVKDVTANKVWLLANNDDESQQKFEAIKKQLHCSFISTTVYGFTVVRS